MSSSQSRLRTHQHSAVRIRSPIGSAKRKPRSMFDTIVYLVLALVFFASLALVALIGEHIVTEKGPSKTAPVATTQILPTLVPQQQQELPSLRGGDATAAVPSTTSVPNKPDTIKVNVQTAVGTSIPITISTIPPRPVVVQKDKKDKKTKKTVKPKKKYQNFPTAGPIDYGPNIYELNSSMSWKTGPRQDLRVNLPRSVDTGSQKELAARALRRQQSLSTTTNNNNQPLRALAEAQIALDGHPLFQPSFALLQAGETEPLNTTVKHSRWKQPP